MWLLIGLWVCCSQTGSGKTLAYLLPIFAKVQPTRAAVQAIVIVPTRELGMQVCSLSSSATLIAISIVSYV